MTLLAIELLTIIQESIKEVTLETHSAITLASMIGIFIIGYFAILTVIYDAWSYHKALLADAIK